LGAYVTGGLHTPELLAAMRKRAAFLAQNPQIKPTVLEQAFIDAHNRRNQKAQGLSA
tara:strand:+ start:154 stop:324 length:171 start_codon:yes stop_codon:yes gene_type:complete